MNTLTTTVKKTGLPAGQSKRKACCGNCSGDHESGRAELTPRRVAARAYEIFQARNRDGGAGDEASDWLQAERELSVGVPNHSTSADLDFEARARGQTLLAGGK